jgi:hypothetical protein
LIAGTVITGVYGYAYYQTIGTTPQFQWHLWDGTGALLRNGAILYTAGSSAVKTAADFATTYTVPTTGYYYIGIRFSGTGSTFGTYATVATLGSNMLNNINGAGTTTTTLGQISSGSCPLASATNISGLTYTISQYQIYFGLY